MIYFQNYKYLYTDIDISKKYKIRTILYHIKDNLRNNIFYRENIKFTYFLFKRLNKAKCYEQTKGR